ncbi:expressed protein [Dictyostelium purpureum]|uniref:Expressed protein n=1 Tax=Dictyostelium purpureum TaxID=5786 RepID=F0Z7T6_DICPU|nr:uncharacterized protein DICPUDRAFT_96385 [Dictyostelium purpureum]EGC39965.1 expressed protein [Dictyostelium purpureum]|eukprot:XP_003283468.1 expressed protein [Dictyostelium purpureum]
MKLLLVLILSFFAFSNGKLVKITHTSGNQCNGKIRNIEIMSLCTFKNKYDLRDNQLTFYDRNSSQPYTCDSESFAGYGTTVSSGKCYPDGETTSFSYSTIEGKTVEKALENVPEGSCNDIYYVDGECNNNFYISTYVNNSCVPKWVEEYNTTVYIKVNCDKDTLKTSLYSSPDCSDAPINVAPSPYKKRNCDKTFTAQGTKSNDVYHSFVYKPIPSTPSTPSNHPNPTKNPYHDDNLDPNNAIKAIPSLFAIVLVIISLIF